MKFVRCELELCCLPSLSDWRSSQSEKIHTCINQFMATACRAHSRGLLLLGDPKNTLLRDRCSNMRGGPTQNVQLFQCFFLKKLF